MKCPGCGGTHEEIGRSFIVLDGDNNWHYKCWDKEVNANG